MTKLTRIDIYVVIRLILLFALPVAAVVDEETAAPHIRARNLVRSGELCVDLGEDIGEVTFNVSDKHYWFCSHQDATCHACASGATPSWGRGSIQMCRRINDKYYQIMTPGVALDWLEKIGFTEGNCIDTLGAVDRYIDMDLVEGVEQRDVVDYDCFCPCDCRADHGAISFDEIKTRTSYQREGYPCLIERDIVGAGECKEGICWSPSGATFGKGSCTRMVPFAKKQQLCLVELGTNACVTGHVCSPINTHRVVKAGIIRTGVCTSTGTTARNVDADGVGWYPDYSVHECILSCDESLGGFCGGIAETWEEQWLLSTAKECCENKLWWLKKSVCVPDYVWV